MDDRFLCQQERAHGRDALDARVAAELLVFLRACAWVSRFLACSTLPALAALPAWCRRRLPLAVSPLAPRIAASASMQRLASAVDRERGEQPDHRGIGTEIDQ